MSAKENQTTSYFFENKSSNQLISKEPRLLVAVNHTSESINLLLWAKDLSNNMKASLQAIYIENTPELSQGQKEQLDKINAKAMALNIELRIISHDDIAKGIALFAKKERITHILIGKPKVYNLLTFFRRGDFINDIVRYTDNMHIYILGSKSTNTIGLFKEKIILPTFNSQSKEYLITFLIIILSAIGCLFLKDYVGYRVISFVLLFVVSLLAFAYGTGPILLSSTLSALIWNFFFIPPHYTLHIDNTEDMLMFFMFFIIALLNGVLTSRVRRQEMKTRIREERTHALYQLANDLSEATGFIQVKKVALVGIKKHFKLTANILLENDLYAESSPEKEIFTKAELDAINECFTESKKGGCFTGVYPDHRYSYFPLIGNQMKIGIIVLKQINQFTHDDEQFLNVYLGQISGKFEREILRDLARNAYLLNESDKLYKTLFNSISHELRIPVTTILGATDILLHEKYPEEIQRKLHSEINIASIRLNHLIENLLNISRLESGRLTIRTDWCDVHDLANRATLTLKHELQPFIMNVIIPENMPLVKIDFGLMEQVICNLLLNATQYSPVNSKITLEFRANDNTLTIKVTDKGPGFPKDELTSVFNKFYRGKTSRTGGTGLGLSIVKGFIDAHKGTVEVANNKKKGAQFTIKIPIDFPQINKLPISK